MKVTLTKRLGQNKPGTVIDTTVTQARWMYERGVAMAADEPEQADQAAGTEQPTSTGQQATDSSDTSKTGRGRRGTKTASGAKSAGDE